MEWLLHMHCSAHVIGQCYQDAVFEVAHGSSTHAHGNDLTNVRRGVSRRCEQSAEQTRVLQ